MFIFLSSIVYSFPHQERILDQDVTSVLSFRPNTIWRHAANLSFFSGQSYQLNYSQHQEIKQVGYSSVSEVLGLGVSYHQNGDQRWWNTTTALSIPFSPKFGAGLVWGWHHPGSSTERYDSFSTADLSLSFRPFSFLGFSAGTRNLGSSHPDVSTEYYSGLGLRTFSGALALGADWTMKDNENRYEGTLTLQPISGLEIRVFGNSTGSWGGGLHLTNSLGYFGGSYHPDQQQINYVQRVPNGRATLSKNKLVSFSLRSSYSYQPSNLLFQKSGMSYLDILHQIHEAAIAQDVQTIVFRIPRLQLSYAQLQEIAQEIQHARNTGKEVVVYINGDVDTKSYFLASFANKILMHPAANFSVVGIFSERMYLRGFLDLIGVTPEVVRRSAYKSSPEQFTHTQSSPASQEQTQERLSSLFSRICSTIAKNRNIDTKKVQDYIDQAPYTAQESKEIGFIDGLHYPDELEDLFDEWFDSPQKIDNYGRKTFDDGWEQQPEIAVLYASGMIVSGSSQDPGLFGGINMVGSQTLIKQIEKSQKDDNIKAVVLRVDSPGGSAFASEEIWRALQLLKKEKPLIISMGGVAASGGYYIAAAGDRIFAEPTTVTGSIGVYINRFQLDKLYNLLGIGVENFSMGNHAGIYGKSQGWTSSEREKMEHLVEDAYRLFKTRVADGRSLTPQEVEAIAQGRVWSGEAAKTQKLVDEMGGIYEAILHAKLKSGIKSTKEIQIRTFSGTQDRSLPLTQMVQQSISNQQTSIFTQISKELAPLTRDTIWAVLPYYEYLQ
ncbi:MAG: signal peptide peptidase SppA [Deltaproteobacteria bacterium]|nr:signal peptide peptidase SppA [Deltaproteobacteria bacterium]